jgi:hypothetical protein
MQPYIRVLRQRVRDSRYAVDEAAVAEAVLARARPRLNADRAHGRKRLTRLDQQIKQFRVENLAAASPGRSVRRSTSRRASSRYAAARNRQHNTTARIIEFLTGRPQSTAGDLTRGLDLDPEAVSACLSRLRKAGDIKKHGHG